MCLANWYGSGWWLVPCIVMCLMSVFLVVFAIACFRNRMGANSRWPCCHWQEKNVDDALAVAKRRYASGEISKDDFEEMKKTIL